MTTSSARHDREGEGDTVLDPRDAFAELGRIVLDRETTETVLQRVAELAQQTLGADEVSVSLNRGRSARTVVWTGETAKSLDETQYEDGWGPCLAAADGGTPTEVADARTEERWPAYAKHAQAAGVLSSLSLPVPVQEHVTAALNLYFKREHGYDETTRELGATFASYAAVAIANMQLHESTKKLAEDLDTAMRSRAVIEQAKGILIGERRCTPDEAFAILVDLSSRSNRKLRDVAQALVDTATATE